MIRNFALRSLCREKVFSGWQWLPASKQCRSKTLSNKKNDLYAWFWLPILQLITYSHSSVNGEFGFFFHKFADHLWSGKVFSLKSNLNHSEHLNFGRRCARLAPIRWLSVQWIPLFDHHLLVIFDFVSFQQKSPAKASTSRPALTPGKVKIRHANLRI